MPLSSGTQLKAAPSEAFVFCFCFPRHAVHRVRLVMALLAGPGGLPRQTPADAVDAAASSGSNVTRALAAPSKRPSARHPKHQRFPVAATGATVSFAAYDACFVTCSLCFRKNIVAVSGNPPLALPST